MTICVAIAVGYLAFVGALARAAFRRARRRAAPRLAPALGTELRMHKLECLGEPPQRVELELHALLGASCPEPGAMSRMVACARDRLARVVPDLKRQGTVARRS
jgi:hypothetical protein